MWIMWENMKVLKPHKKTKLWPWQHYSGHWIPIIWPVARIRYTLGRIMCKALSYRMFHLPEDSTAIKLWALTSILDIHWYDCNNRLVSTLNFSYSLTYEWWVNGLMSDIQQPKVLQAISITMSHNRTLRQYCSMKRIQNSIRSVSYTHLTLPTKRIV